MRDSKITGSPSLRLAATVLLALVISGVLLSRPLQLPLAAVGFVLALLALRLGVMASSIAGDGCDTIAAFHQVKLQGWQEARSVARSGQGTPSMPLPGPPDASQGPAPSRRPKT